MASVIIFPTELNIFTAGIICRKNKTTAIQVYISARDNIARRLNLLVESGQSELIIIIAPFKINDEIKTALDKAAKNRIQIEWYSDQHPELKSQLQKKHNLTATLTNDSHTPSQPVKDYIRYKKSLAFLGDANGQLANNHLIECINHIAKSPGQIPPNDQVAVTSFEKMDFPAIEGRSGPMRKLKQDIHRVAAAGIDKILLLGETGTGKEAAALFLHTLDPNRKDHQFGAINCAALQEEFLISELFGHEKGAFTGAIQRKEGLVETLKGGTLFLDEIPDMPPRAQAMLLRFLESGTYTALGSSKEKKANLKIVSAGQKSILLQKIQDKSFRLDLYFRLNGKTIPLPNLRDIPEDIPTLVVHLAYKIEPNESEKRDAAINYFYDQDRMSSLQNHSWPGNVRELANYVSRKIKLGTEENINLNEFNFLKTKDSTSIADDDKIPKVNFYPGKPIEKAESIKKNYVKQVHNYLGGKGYTQKKICEELGLSINTLKKILTCED